MKLKNIIAFSLLCCGMINTSAQQKDIYLADPTIFSEHGIYYMYGTVKSSQSGFPVLTSTNLKRWNVPVGASGGFALLKGNSTFGAQGFWAPQIFKRNGTYYMAYTANENIAIARSDSPLGPFTQKSVGPIDPDTRKIDPFFFTDDDGKIYLYHVRLHEGNSIWVAELTPDLSDFKKETLTQCITATEPWEDTKLVKAPPIIEGPTVIKHKGIYYLFYSANDYRSIDYSVGYATAPTPYGPWTKYHGNPIINRKVIGANGTGHGDIFYDKSGNMNYIFHTHNSDSTVHERRTMIVGVKFGADKNTNIDAVEICKKRLIKPELQK
jgi:Beta-xylosidase